MEGGGERGTQERWGNVDSFVACAQSVGGGRRHWTAAMRPHVQVDADGLESPMFASRAVWMWFNAGARLERLLRQSIN